MAKAAAKQSRLRDLRERATDSFASRVGSEFLGLSLLGAALLSCLALATYSPADPIFELAPVSNRVGPVGASIAGWLFGEIGYGAIVVVAATAWLGGRLVLGRGWPNLTSRFWTGVLLLLLSISTLPPLLDSMAPGRLGSPEGGVVGSYLASREALFLGSWGTLLVNGLFFVLGVLRVTGIATASALETLGAGAGFVGERVAAVLFGLWSVMRRLVVSAGEGVRQGLLRVRQMRSPLVAWRARNDKRARVAELRKPNRSTDDVVPVAADLPDAEEGDWEEGEEEWEESEEGEWEEGEEGEEGEWEEGSEEDWDEGEWEEEEEADDSNAESAAEPHIVDHVDAPNTKVKPEQEAFRFKDNGPVRPFTLPDLSIFSSGPDESRGYDRDSLLMNSRILEKKLADFGVDGRVVRVHPGPVVTMYEYEPAAGVKVNRIVNLTDDLAMALCALSIRIIAPLPGKSVVGIEVPNPERETVYLRPLLESRSFRSGDAKLAVTMGRDIFGNTVESDLAKMPHLLVAGATGTGKSVFLNAVLCSLLCRCTPYELKFLMIDPKMLELSIYDGIPHLIAEVVTNPKRAAAALKGVLQKMEERYQMMSALQVRNIEQFNAVVEKELAAGNETFRLKPKPGEAEGVEVRFEHLPFIVVVVDELADLMVVASKDVEESLQRLAQMARAAGIHLVLATQRPSVDVLTGVIKANFPSRVSFQVSSAIDSRTVLDQKGAESLLGHGDMLFLPPGTSQLARVHGPFVTEKEVSELVAYLRDQGEPEFDEDLVNISIETTSTDRDGEDLDEMFDPAVAIVSETRNASISYIQRRLKIGYNRAARIIEQMELDGMVGPQEGTRPREVYLPEHGDPEQP